MSQSQNGGMSGGKAVITASLVKELRARTGAGMMDCRSALEESEGNLEKSILVLRRRGVVSAEKKKGRAATEGRIESYIHFGGKIGTLLEINCETDFVAKTKEFQDLCKNLSMQVAASNPKWVSRDNVPKELVEEERKLYQAAGEKEIDKRLEKFYQIHCLLEQPYIKEPNLTVSSVIKEAIAKVGENIVVKRFARFALGEN